VGASPTERISEVEAFRRIDTSLRRLATELVRALTGLAVAHLAGRWLVEGPLDLDGSPRGVVATIAVHVALAGVALFATSAHPIRRDLAHQRRAVLASEEAILARVAQQTFLSDVHDAFEMGATEADALAVVPVALAGAHDGPAELLLADSSRAHLQRAVTVPGHEAPGCRVDTPWACPAVRRGQSLSFDDATGLGACPRLRERSDEAASAVCVPVTILGTPTAVLHATSTRAGAWDDPVIDRLEGIAAQLGARLGVLRAMARSQLQAETDPLTGLLNRRALEERVRALRLAGGTFAVAMADLDHFKQLNDRHGHDSGDRALRTFARVVREAVRAEDLVSRHGGEEFVVILPGLDAGGATSVLERLREQLRQAVGSALVPEFTVSLGVADSSWSTDLDDVLRAADRALLDAKAAGRDRLVVASAPPVVAGLG
jgi:diguanylate cyclase (GGDEF)-like protein